jgi:GTPase SAR1 family protein
MLIRYMKGEFSGQYNVTVGVEFASRSVRVESGHDVKLQIWDTVVVSLFRLGRKLFEPSFAPSIKALQQYFSALPLISLRAWKLSECGLEK